MTREELERELSFFKQGEDEIEKMREEAMERRILKRLGIYDVARVMSTTAAPLMKYLPHSVTTYVPHMVSSTNQTNLGRGGAMVTNPFGADPVPGYLEDRLVEQALNAQMVNAHRPSPVRVVSTAKVRPVTVDLDAIETLTSDMVRDYGIDAMERSANLSERLLQITGAEQSQEFADKLHELVALAKGLDPRGAAKSRSLFRRLLNLFGLAKNKVTEQFKMLDLQIGSLAKELETHSQRQIGRDNDLQGLFDENMNSYQEIEKLVQKGRAYLGKAKPVIGEVANPMEAQKIQDRADLEHRLDKRLSDLDVAMTLMVQTAPEIRVMQANARALVDKFTTLTKLTIPAWKKQFALNIVQTEQRHSAVVADAVDNATNEAVRKNADQLHENATQIAAAGQRQILDVATVEHVQKQLIATVQDVRAINQEAARERVETTGKLENIRLELTETLRRTTIAIPSSALSAVTTGGSGGAGTSRLSGPVYSEQEFVETQKEQQS